MLEKNQQHNLVILDFGSQYSQLIARRIREIGVYCEIHRYDIDEKTIDVLNPKGVILSGGPESVTEGHTPRAPQWVFDKNIPVLGICYGMQTMALQLGGEVACSEKGEYGFADVSLHHNSPLFAGIYDQQKEDQHFLHVWMSHGDHVTKVPHGFQVIASTENAPVVAMANLEKNFYALQFHPEVTHTTQGMRILERFVKDVCACETKWTLDSIIESAIEKIKKQVGDDEVLLALSGGVDSSVVALLLQQAIGDRLTCVFVDTGLLRYQEAEQVMQMFAQHMHIRVIKVDAKQRFYDQLQGVEDPEDKRKVIGRLFIEAFDVEAKKLKNIKWLAQGTIYPDVIESAAASTQTAHVIKSHHNVGGLPKDMKLKLVEPLRELFKDEVRKCGLKLGLPHEMLYRHPFPGPGLGVRILGEVKSDYVPILQKADHIFMQELRAHDLYDKVSQAFAVFLPVKSVAVKGDSRRYEYVIALRAVETIDFMTATWAELPHAFLSHVSNRICNEVPHVSRVVYDISGKPPATIEWE